MQFDDETVKSLKKDRPLVPASVSLIVFSIPSLSLALSLLIQEYKCLFVKSYEIYIVLCRWQRKAHKICFIR